VESSVDVDDGWFVSLLDRSTGKVSLGRLGRRRTQTLFSFLRVWNNGRHLLRFEDRSLQGKAKGPALLLRWDGANGRHGGASKRRHTGTSAVDEYQSRAPPGPAGDGAPWSEPASMLDLDGPLSGGQGRPAAKGARRARIGGGRRSTFTLSDFEGPGVLDRVGRCPRGACRG
jgi:hypothetical protein